MSDLRIYVASLSDYNNGGYHGRWIDIDNSSDVDDIQEEIAEMLRRSPAAKRYGDVAEEWAIHDYDGFKGFTLGEHESLERIVGIAQVLEEYPASVVAHYANDNSSLNGDDLKSLIEDHFVATIEECMGDEVQALAEHLYESVADDPDLPERYRDHAQGIAESMARSDINGGVYHVLYDGLGTHQILSTD
ncbi:antirestriction protein ArdA [Streptomyces sp. NPDC058268]|uniref:antirestriction protein ArdA n=1 Tax=Streptomyces sp. NPDC058268 TaxID=3346413 RepID=UPI0036E1538B